MVPAAIAAVLTGNLLMYLAGRFGVRLLGGRAERLEGAFRRHGPTLLLAGRFVPGVRAALLVAAGAARVPLSRLAACDGTAALAGAALSISVGARLAAHLGRARALVGQARGAVVVVALVVALVLVARRLARRARPSEVDVHADFHHAVGRQTEVARGARRHLI